MAIDIQQPNYSGLVAIAGKSAPLNIQPTGALGLQALQQQQANAAALRANALGQAQLQQQGQIAQGSQNIQQRQLDQQYQQQLAQQRYNSGLLQQASSKNKFDQALDAAKYQQAGLKDQNSLAMDVLKYQQTGANQQNDVALRSQKNQLDAHKQMMDQLNKDNETTLKEKGAFASYGLLSMRNAKSPEEAQQIRAEIIKDAVKKKYISEDDAAAAAKMPSSQFSLLLGSQIVNAGVAKDFKAQQEALRPEQTGLTQVFDPQTGQLVYSAEVTKPEKNKFEADIVGAKDSLREINNLYQNVTPDMFGASALKQNVTYLRELGQSIPGIGKYLKPSTEDTDALTKYSNLQAATNGLAMDVIKEKSGVQYSDQQLQFMMKILPEFGPTIVKSVFDGKVQNLNRYLGAVIQSREELLKNKFKLGTPEFEQAMSKKIDDIQLHFFDSDKVKAALDAGHSQAEIDAWYAAHKGQ